MWLGELAFFDIWAMGPAGAFAEFFRNFKGPSAVA
jgi:hypothetical protein